MSNLLRRSVRSGAVGLCAFVVSAASVLGQGPADVRIYSGLAAKASGVTLEPWGSGVVTESAENVFTGSSSVRILSQGLYGGARLVLAQPADVKALISDPTVYLRVVVKVAESDKNKGYGGSSGMMMPGGRMGPGMNKNSGGSGGMLGGPGGSGGQGGYGGLGGSGSVGTAMVKPQAVENVRVALVTADKKTVETLLTMSDTRISEGEWRVLAIPLSLIPAFKSTDGQIAEVHVFADLPATLYLGEVRTVKDETPIHVTDMVDRTVAVNDEVTFTGDADGGVSPLKYDWTYAAAGELNPADGPLPVDAENRVEKHRFRKSGDYDVFLTVRDVYGLKKPAVSKVHVHVTL